MISKALFITYWYNLALSQYLLLFFIYTKIFTAFVWVRSTFLIIFYLFSKLKKDKLRYPKGRRNFKTIMPYLYLLSCKNIFLS